jgi:hypothetical protein
MESYSNPGEYPSRENSSSVLTIFAPCFSRALRALINVRNVAIERVDTTYSANCSSVRPFSTPTWNKMVSNNGAEAESGVMYNVGRHVASVSDLVDLLKTWLNFLSAVRLQMLSGKEVLKGGRKSLLLRCLMRICMICQVCSWRTCHSLQYVMRAAR